MLKSRTLIATPAYRGDVVMQYAHSIVRDAVVALAMGHFIEAPHFINNTYIHMARNDAVKAFMKGDFDYLMFIDADMGWEASALPDVLDLPADMDVVGGVYRAKESPPRYPVNYLPDVPREGPVYEVAGVATGFMRITRKCLEKTLAKYPHGRLFHHIVDENEIEWGDDMAFCIRARAAGCRVYGKFDIEFEHVGPHAWKGRAQDDLSAPMPANPKGLVFDPAHPFGNIPGIKIADLPKPVRAFA